MFLGSISTALCIKITGQRTRRASCSRKGNLSFNWKLLMSPEPVIDYVVIHELSHLKEMNHSQKFWQVAAGCCPRWLEMRKLLKKHDAYLTGGLRERPGLLKEPEPKLKEKYPGTARNAACPCGSGKKYKKCHGR